MKTKMNLARGGGASASKKLLAAIAVLAVAFVVFAAIPAVDADETSGSGSGTGTANTFYVNAISGNDTKDGLSDANAFKTLSKAIATAVNGDTIVLLSDLNADNEGSNLVTFTQTGLTSCNTKVLKVTKAVTLQSKTGEKFNIPFSLGIDIAAVAGSSGSVGTLTLKDLKISPTDVAYGLMASENIRVDIVVDGCEFTVNPDVEGSTKQVAAIWLYQTTYDTTVKDSKFFVGDNKGNQYASAIMIWNGQDITLTGNEATGYARFANIDGSNTVVISGNTGKNMVGPLYIGNDVKGGMFVNIATTQGDVTKYTASFTMTGNKISGDSGFIPAQIYPSNTNRTGITDLTADCDLVVKGPLAVNGAMNVNGNITTQSEVETVVPSITVEQSGTLTIPAGKTLTVAKSTNMTVEGTLKVSKNATLSVAGNLAGKGTVDNKGVVESLNGGNITAPVTGNETTSRTDDSQMENVSIEGTVKGTDNVFDKDQLATVKGNSVMAEDSKLVINGKLYIPEGATLTLMPGAQLVLQNNAVLEVEGKLIIEEPYDSKVAKIDVVSGKIIVSGSIEDGGEVNVTSGSVEIKADGAVIVGEAGKLVSSKVSVEESATLQINGTLGDDNEEVETVVENAGTVIFDSKVASENVTINMKNGGAVDVKNLTLKDDGTVTVKDGGNTAVLKANVTPKSTPVAPAYAAAVISGITVTEQITSKTENNQTVYTYVMDISGNAVVDYVYVASGSEDEIKAQTVAASITLTGSSVGKSGITVTGALTVGENVTLNNAGKLTVSATVDASKGAFVNKATIGSTETAGTLTVIGEGKVVVKTEIGPTVNAAKYVTGTGSDKLYNYVTLDAALAAANAGTTKDIAVLGQQALTASATLPKDVKLDLKDATVTIGEDAKATGVTLTVASGASVKNAPASIAVYGTVYAEKKTDIDSAVREKLTAGADVYSEELNEKGQAVRDGWAKWTNIATALIEAPEGSVVKITKNPMEIKTDLTIPEKITLDTNGKNVIVSPGVTITVNGTLSITNDGNTFVLSKKTDDKDAAKIVLNGNIVSNDAIKFIDDAQTSAEVVIGAAYYSITTKNVTKYYATTVEKAAPLISTVDEQKITLKGAELTAGDVSFEGKSVDEPAAVVVEAGKLTVSSITLANAKIEFTGGQTFQGTIKDAAGSIVLKGTAGSAAITTDEETTTPAVSFSVESGKALAVSGNFTGGKDAVVFSGAVSVKSGKIDNAKVEGTLTVAGDATISKIVVNGAVSIDAGATLTVTDAEVFGTIAGAAKTADKAEGKIAVKTMYIGFAAKDITIGAAASVTGDIVLTDHAVAAPGTTVPEAFTKDDSVYNTTVLKVKGEIYATVYSVDYNSTNSTGCNHKLGIINPHVENAYCAGWYDKDGPADNKTFPNVDEAEAKIVYDIYKIVLKADEGIADVYLNGQAMYYGLVNGTNGYYYAYTATVSAGEYKVTYTLKNGWSGEAKLTGDNVTGTSFKATGTPANGQDFIPLVYQLSGVEKSGYVEPVTPSEDKDDDGLTITDYLLIVLVVLIVIMAVIVAMRLMRS